jgi:hypothetical protein
MSEFSSYLDGSPTPQWLEDLRRRERLAHAPQHFSPALDEVFTQVNTTSSSSEPPNAVLGRRSKRDWLKPEEDKPWHLP